MARQKSDPGQRRREDLNQTIEQITKDFGKGAIMRLGDDAAALNVSAIPTGALSLDIALGIGGIPRGRVTEIFGPESAGKSTLAQHIIAESQRLGGTTAYIDVEHALDPTYAANCGINIDDLLISQPDTGEQALEICEALIRSNAIDAVIVDSVAALVPRAEIEGDMGDSLPGLQARLMSQALRKLAGLVYKSNTCLVFINQIREKIGVMFGSPETTTGGRALKFYASVRLDIRRIAAIKDGDKIVGNRTRIKVAKNKVAPPFQQAEFDIMYGEGLSLEGDLIDIGVANNLVNKSGAWYSYNEDRIGQGRENAKQFLKDHPDLRDKLERELRAELGLQVSEAPQPELVDSDEDAGSRAAAQG